MPDIFVHEQNQRLHALEVQVAALERTVARHELAIKVLREDKERLTEQTKGRT